MMKNIDELVENSHSQLTSANLKDIIISSVYPFVVIDKDLNVIFSNQKNKNPGSDEKCYSLLFDRNKPCSTDNNCPALTVFKTNKPLETTLKIDNNGNKIYYNINAVPIFKENSGLDNLPPRYVLSQYHNITLRENALKEFSHDTINLHTAAIGICNILLSKYSHNQTVIRYLETINNNLKRTLALTDYLKFENCRPNFEWLQPSEIVSSAVNSLDETVDSEITINNMPKMRADRIMMFKLYRNLIENAVKYRGKANSKLIEIGYDKPAYFVHDKGIGIEKDNIQKIFNFGFQADKNSTGEGEGLYYCRHIVEVIHHGQIWAESKGRNQGTSIYFKLGTEI